MMEYCFFPVFRSVSVPMRSFSAMYFMVFLGLYPAFVRAWFSMEGKM